jgi:hypothetical protein
MNTKTSYKRTLYASERNDIDIALAGEALISQGLSMYREPNYLKLVELIRGADARYVHLEMLFHDYEHPPTDKRMGTHMRCDPKFIADLQWMGFQLMSTAHNHSIDFGEGGVLKTIEHLTRHGVTHAGMGRNLAEARAPAYLESAKGRVGPRRRPASRHDRPAWRELLAPLHGIHRRQSDLRALAPHRCRFRLDAQAGRASPHGPQLTTRQ